MASQTRDSKLNDPLYLDSLLSQQLKFLYSGIPFSCIISAVLGLVLIIVQYPLIPLATSLSWYGLLIIILLMRSMLFIKWRRTHLDSGPAYKCWRHYFRLSVFVTGIIWGVGGLMTMPEGENAHQEFVSFVLGGLAAGSMTSLSADRESVAAFVIPTMGPHIIFLFLQGQAITVGMGVMLLFFMLFLFLSARKAGETLLENAILHLEAVENEARVRMMLDYSPTAASITDIKNQQIIFANKSYASLMGLEPDTILGVSPRQYYADQAEYDEVIKHIKNGERITNRLVALSFNQNANTKWVLASYLQLEYHGMSTVLGWFYDITERKLREEQFNHLAHHDSLTELPNRILFRDRLQQAINMAERNHHLLALMFIDLDNFKPVNDTYGHDTGDEVLRESAKRIQACLRKPDSIARFGGDEFVVLLHEVTNEEDALRVAQKICISLQRSLKIEGKVIRISASIGVALYPIHSTNEDGLINCADLAMYAAKKAGRNSVKLSGTARNN